MYRMKIEGNQTRNENEIDENNGETKT